MRNVLKTDRIRQCGFTLIEVIVAVTVFGLVGAGVAVILSQMFQQNNRASGSTQAIEQVQNLAYWLNSDAMMAQNVSVTGISGVDTGFPVVLDWEVPDTNNNQVNYQATYSFTGNALQRSFSVGGGTPTQTIVANNIDTDAAQTNCSYDAATNVLTFQVTSTVGPSSKTRTYQVNLRVDQPTPAS